MIAGAILRFGAPRRAGSFLAGAWICAALFAAAFVAPAEAQAGRSGPDLDARAWVLIDARDGTRLAAKSAGRSVPIASATKLMTAYLALRDLKPDKKIKAPDYNALPVESVLGLQRGERMEASDLITAILLPSANDAAVTLAEGVSGTVSAFVDEMNDAAADLGLGDSSFRNPIGLDESGHFSSAIDLAKLTMELRSNRRFRKTTAKARATLSSGDVPRTVDNRNNLVGRFDWVDGVKTGRTIGAGYVLVSSGERKGVPLIGVVLGADSEAARDAESLELLRYGFGLYRKKTLAKRGDALATVDLDSRDQQLELVAAKPLKAVARRSQETEITLDVPEQLEGEIQEGERVGTATVEIDGQPAAKSGLVSTRFVAAAGPVERARSVLAPVLITGGVLLGLVFALLGRSRRSDARAARALAGPSGESAGESGRSHAERVRARRRRMEKRDNGERG